MDINDLRSIITVLAFLAFMGIVWWAYSDRRKADLRRGCAAATRR
jgi:cytochrome c oxidase cbb3-type subunit 4